MILIMTLVSKLDASDDTFKSMKLFRAGILCLAALLMTVIWGAIVYFGCMLFGIVLKTTILIEILVGVFLLSLLGLGVAASAADDADPSDVNRDDVL